MVFVDDTQRSALLARAIDAFAVTDSARSHEIYREIVETLMKLCNKNQKEIAAELQQLAKSLERQSGSEQAFEFKQRTCAVMLEISMEDRRRSQFLTPGQNGVLPSRGAESSAGNRAGAGRVEELRTGGRDVSNRPEETTSFEPSATTSSTIIGNRQGTGASSTLGVDTGDIDVVTGPTARSSTPADGFGMRSPPGSTPARSPGSSTTASNEQALEGLLSIQSSATAIDTALPFVTVEYLYLGSSDYERDVTFYLEVLGAQEVWKFDRFGSRITALSLCAGPLILIADHRSAPSCQPVFRVSDLAATARDLMQRGWKPLSGPFGTPNGEAYSFEDPSGNRFAIFEVDETSTDRAYFDPTENE